MRNSSVFCKAVEFFLYRWEFCFSFPGFSEMVCGKTCGKCGKLLLRKVEENYERKLCKLFFHTFPLQQALSCKFDDFFPVRETIQVIFTLVTGNFIVGVLPVVTAQFAVIAGS